MRIVFMGTPQFAVPSLAALAALPIEIAAVVTQPDRPAGRGRKLTPPATKEYALKHNLAVLQPEKIKDPAFLSRLDECCPDMIVVVAYGRILPIDILKIPPLGCVNLHGSLLPRYRGAAPIQWSIINGELESGVTTMQMDEGMDTGPMLLQERTAIGPEETASELSERLSTLGAALLARTVEKLPGGGLKGIAQDSALATYAPILKKEDGLIRWEQDAQVIVNLIRGTYPWPGAYTFYKGKRWRILKTKVESQIEKGKSKTVSPGQIISAGIEGIVVCAGKDNLVIAEIQPENSRAMSVGQYLAGHEVRQGEVFHS